MTAERPCEAGGVPSRTARGMHPPEDTAAAAHSTGMQW